MKKIFNLLINGLLSMVLLSSCANSNSSLTSKNKTPVSSENVISNSSSSNDKITSSSSIVVDKVVSISLNYNDNIKYDYFLNEELDLENVTINVIYESKETKIINVTKDMIKLMDISINQETNMNSVGYKMVIISYEGQEVSYLIHVIDKDAPFDKIDPVVKFNFEAGAVFYLGTDIVPTVDILPNDIDYTITYSSEISGYNSEEYPTKPGTYSMVVKYDGNERYNSINVWRYFYLKGEKETPEITFNYTGGTTFIIGSDLKPTANVSEGAKYTITYSSETTGYNSEEYPVEPGTYALVITVEEDENFYYAKQWLWFRLVSNEKQNAIVTFSYNPGAVFSLSLTDRPMVTISEGADYTIHFSCEAKQLKGETYIFNTFEELEPGYNYSLVVSIKENNLFNADEKWCWFKLVE